MAVQRKSLIENRNEKVSILLDLFGVWAINFRALSKNSGLSSEKSAKSGDGYIIFVYGTFLEETFCMEETNNCLGFWADIMFTPIKSFSTGMSKLHFMFSGNWLHLKNSSKTFNVSFKIRAKKLLILVKKTRLMKVHFRVMKKNLRQTSSEKKDYQLWYLYAQSSISFRMVGIEILKICENCFLRWGEIFLLWKFFPASCKTEFLQKLIEISSNFVRRKN